MENDTVAENIKRLRMALGMTQAEFAKRCGLAPSAVCQFESGQRVPSLPVLRRIKRGIGMTWEALLS